MLPFNPLRIAIVSDIHGNLAALEAVAADIKRRCVDLVANLGDSLSGPLLPLETASFLMTCGWNSLAGNHERQLLSLGSACKGLSDAFAFSHLTGDVFDWMRSLAPAALLVPGVLLCHGTPRSDTEFFLESSDGGRVRHATSEEIEARLGDETAEVVACGHTHVARAVRSRKGQLLVNPGSVGLPAFEEGRGEACSAETGSPDARYAIVERTTEGWTALHVAVPYDNQSMARLARERGRPDWEQALLTGYIARRTPSGSPSAQATESLAPTDSQASDSRSA